ncbi:Copper transport protein [Aphelenchoides besseyi]|nr:Copper transport protein [Aphelenchoides besseyi]
MNTMHGMDSSTMHMMHNGTMKMHKMWMWFHTALEDTVLFEFWTVNSTSAMVASCAIVFCVAFLLEAIKYWRLLVEKRTVDFHSLPYKSKLFSLAHLMQTLLFGLQVGVGYLLMLVFMTFSIWLGLSVAAGSAFGFYLFGAKPVNLKVEEAGAPQLFSVNEMMHMNMDMMIMYFHQRIREHILIRQWYPTTQTEYIVSCVGIVLLGISLEAFKTLRLYLYREADKTGISKGCCGADLWSNTSSYGATNVPSAEQEVCDCAPERAVLVDYRPYSPKFLLNGHHQIQSLLYFVQAFLSYSLMLVAMTWNTALFLSLILGHILGFFIFAPLFTAFEKVRVGDCCCG